MICGECRGDWGRNPDGTCAYCCPQSGPVMTEAPQAILAKVRELLHSARSYAGNARANAMRAEQLIGDAQELFAYVGEPHEHDWKADGSDETMSCKCGAIAPFDLGGLL